MLGVWAVPRLVALTIAVLSSLVRYTYSFASHCHRPSTFSVRVAKQSVFGVLSMMAKGGKGKKGKAARRSSSGVASSPTVRTRVGSDGGESDGKHDEGVPRLIVMDLDYTLWNPELYQMRGSPFGRDERSKVRDRSGTVIDLFPGVREILLAVHRDDRFKGSTLAIASRTEHGSWAREVMGLLEVEPGMLMRDVFTTRLSEIYRGTKVRHFGELRKNSGIPYDDMIFFDDWDQNCKEVGKLGVTCIECPRGLNQHVWNRGLDRFRAAKKSLRP